MKVELIAPFLLLFTIDHVVFIGKVETSDTNESGYGKGCYYNGKFHKTSWEEGCNYICFCNNTETGYFQCHRRCPVYKDLPPDCTLELPPGEPCCKIPVCTNTTTTTAATTAGVQYTQPYTTSYKTTDVYPLVQSQRGSKTVNNARRFSDVNIGTTLNTIKSIDVPSDTINKNTNETENTLTNQRQQTDTIDFTFDLSQFAFDNPITTTEITITENNASKDAGVIDSDSSGHYMKHMLSMEEINPIELSSVNDIVFDIPNIDDQLQIDLSDNYSGQNNLDDGKIKSQDNNDSFKTELNDSKHEQKLNNSNEIPPEIFPADIRQFDSERKRNSPDNSSKGAVQDNPVFEQTFSHDKTHTKIKNEPNDVIVTVNEVLEQEIVPSNYSKSIYDPKNHKQANKPIDEKINATETTISVNKNETGVRSKGTKARLNREHNINYTKISAHNNSSTIVPSITPKTTINKITRIDKSVETHGERKTVSGRWSLLRQRSKVSSSLPRPVRCVYMGMRFNTRQTWFDGCNQICICLDAKTGFFRCTERCPVYKSVPRGCEMKRSSADCCPLPNCSNSTITEKVTTVTRRPMTIADRFNKRVSGLQASKFIGQFTGDKAKPLTTAAKLYILTHLDAITDGRNSSNNKSRSGIVVHTATGLYRLSEAKGDNLVRQGELTPVLPRNKTSTKNTTHLQKGVDENIAPFQTVLGLCQYDGKRYNPGETWEIGCILVCECLPGIQGQYACRRRCKQYPVIPFGCSLQLPPNEPCCKTIHCHTASMKKTTLDNQNQQRPFTDIIQHTGYSVTKKSIVNRQFKHKTTLSARLFKRSNSSQILLKENISLHPISRLVISPPSKMETVSSLKKGSNYRQNISNHIELTAIPTNGVTFSQTGAVLISKNAGGKTGHIQAATTGCIVGDKVYRKGQSWKIGCKLRCFCADDVKRTMSCNRLCPKWQLPTECTLETPLKGKCCPVPKCPDGYFIKYPHGYIPL